MFAFGGSFVWAEMPGIAFLLFILVAFVFWTKIVQVKDSVARPFFAISFIEPFSDVAHDVKEVRKSDGLGSAIHRRLPEKE